MDREILKDFAGFVRKALGIKEDIKILHAHIRVENISSNLLIEAGFNVPVTSEKGEPKEKPQGPSKEDNNVIAPLPLVVKPKKKTQKRGRKRSYTRRVPTTSDDDAAAFKPGEIRHARAVIKKRIKDGKLDENQVAAFDRHKDKPYKKLSNLEMQQIMDIYKDSGK